MALINHDLPENKHFHPCMPPKPFRLSKETQPRPNLPIAIPIAKVRKYDSLTLFYISP